jgi:hypothetical protein
MLPSRLSVEVLCVDSKRVFLDFFFAPLVERNAIFSFPKPSSGCSCSSLALYPLELKLGAVLLAEPQDRFLRQLYRVAKCWRNKDMRRFQVLSVFAFLSGDKLRSLP